jgi:hypothetical protein
LCNRHVTPVIPAVAPDLPPSADLQLLTSDFL